MSQDASYFLEDSYLEDRLQQKFIKIFIRFVLILIFNNAVHC